MASIKMLNLGRCEICGQPIMVSAAVVERMINPATTCTRKCQNIKIGKMEAELDED